MPRFTIRETILATATTAILIAWAVDHGRIGKQLTESEANHRRLGTQLAESEADHVRLRTQLAESAAANRIWQFRAEHLRGQFNGTKLGGKWLMPHRLEFDPDSEQIYTAKRTSGGEWVAAPGTMIEWRLDWADLR